MPLENRNNYRQNNAKLKVIENYLLLLFSTVVISYFVLYHINSFAEYNVENVRVILSTLIQSEVSVFAIVISLSLVAVQLASMYSARVIDIYIKDINFQIITFIYISTITSTLYVLRSLPPGDIFGFEYYISTTYYLGIFAFIALLIYVREVLNLMKPSTLIDCLA
jgi:uncharacterized membrane protein